MQQLDKCDTLTLMSATHKLSLYRITVQHSATEPPRHVRNVRAFSNAQAVRVARFDYPSAVTISAERVS